MPYVFPILEALLLPPGLFVLFILAGLLLLALGRRRSGAVLGLSAALLLYLCSIIPVANLLIVPLEDHYPPYRPTEAADARFVVVLGGGVIPVSPAAGGRPTLSPDSLKRIVYGEEIAAAARLPLIVSGGTSPLSPAAEPEAAVARRTLMALGVPRARILEEDRSRNTWENAAQVERDYHPGKVILVTSAFHMPRSVLAFNRNHIRAVPAPTDYLSDRAGYNLYSFLPHVDSLRITAIALKEYLGYLYYRIFLVTTRHSS